ncbi:39S ribosomal protein L38-like, partial [Homarus americanus]
MTRLLLTSHKTPLFQPFRSVWQNKIKVNVYPSLRERLEELDQTRDDPGLYAPVNIGFTRPKPSRREQLHTRLQHRKSLKENESLQQRSRRGDQFLCLTLAEHYGIFRDLYGSAYFVPYVALGITYDLDDHTVSPVHRGNTIKPGEAAREPSVQFRSEPGDLWTLILSNPDGNLLDNEAECLHWFIGNIQGNDLTSGDVVCNYLQPFPPRGTGYHRLVFVLYKQERHIDYSRYTREQPCVSLKDRSFSTSTFYREQQDHLTPAGLSWYQTDWDSSLTHFFHHTLRLNPLEPEPPVVPFPAAQPIHRDLSSWERRDLKRQRLGVGKY